MSTSKHNIHNEIITLYQLLSMEERIEILTKLLDESVLPSSHNTPPKSLSAKRELDSPFSPHEGGSHKSIVQLRISKMPFTNCYAFTS